jgi:hypothetical protein
MNVNNENKGDSKRVMDEQGGNNTIRADDNISLTVSQRARIEKNKRTALFLKQAKLIPHPYAKM